MKPTTDTPTARPRGFGRIFRRKGSACWWIAYMHRGKEIRESSESENWKVAEKLLKHRLKEIGADQLGARRFIGPAPERVEMGELLDALESHLKLGGKYTPQVRAHLKPIRAAFGDLKALAVTTGRIDGYIEDRLAPQQVDNRQVPGKSPATVNRETQLLHQAFHLAVDRGQLAFLPKVRHLSEASNVRRGFFEREEFEAVVVKLPEYLQDFVRFDYGTGWRKGELQAFRWTWVDGETVRIPPEYSKNREGHSVPLEGELLEIIERRRAARAYTRTDGVTALSEYVFHRNGKSIGDFRKAWKTACAAAGVPGKLVHDFRRTAARDMVRGGTPETVAMTITGHKTRAMFDRYNITSEQDQREALRRTQEYRKSKATGPRVVVLADEAAKMAARKRTRTVVGQ